ncbi:hypothetical protein ABU549_004422 [Yersinia enterocolitica]|uniref:hypothetical protein n=1 Tax=Yersinia enterocolitica TaxID=630 RepID=UPI00313C4CC9
MTYKELNETMTEDAFRLKRILGDGRTWACGDIADELYMEECHVLFILAQMEHFKMVSRKVSGRYYLTPEYLQACQSQ